jgi:hypothetical protein
VLVLRARRQGDGAPAALGTPYVRE